VILAHPLRYITYALTYLGAPVTRGAVEFVFDIVSGDSKAICDLGDSDLCSYVNTTAVAGGVIGILAFVWVLWQLRRRLRSDALAPLLGLSVYALASAILTSFGRASLGNHQALAQRYATIAGLFWIALVVLACVYRAVATPALRYMISVALVLFACSLTMSSLEGRVHFMRQYAFLAPARPELLSLQHDDLIGRLFPNPEFVRQHVHTLKEHRLSVFRKS